MLTRFSRTACLVGLIAALLVPVAGCGSGPFGMRTEEEVKQTAAEKAWNERIEAGVAKDAAAKKAAEASAAFPFAGKWSFPYMIVDEPAKKMYLDTALYTITISKQGEGYVYEGSGEKATVVVSGETIIISGNRDGPFLLKGSATDSDTIVGSRHQEYTKLDLVWDGPWTATRVK